MKWWEKTVEYFFLARYLPEGFFIAPLDGDLEKAGDAKLKTLGWVLIEFKRTAAAIRDEINDKFETGMFDKAKEKLGGHDGHHWFVIGFKNAYEKFDVMWKTYFSHQNKPDLFDSGIELNAFKKYVEDFISFKKKKPGDSGDEDFSMVLGICKDAKKICCVPLVEFVRESNLSLKSEAQQPQIERQQHRPSRPKGMGER